MKMKTKVLRTLFLSHTFALVICTNTDQTVECYFLEQKNFVRKNRTDFGRRRVVEGISLM